MKRNQRQEKLVQNNEIRSENKFGFLKKKTVKEIIAPNGIDASHIDITAMGQMNNGGGSGGGPDENAITTDEAESGENGNTDDKAGHKGFGPGNMPGGGFDGGNMPDMGSFDSSNMPEGFDGNMPDMGSFGPQGSTADSSVAKIKKLAEYGACLVAMIAAFFIVKAHKRRRIPSAKAHKNVE